MDGDEVHQEQPYSYVPAIQPAAGDKYTGFGFNSWKSGPQAFPDLTKLYDGNLARSFQGKSGFGIFLKNVFHQLDNAVSVDEH